GERPSPLRRTRPSFSKRWPRWRFLPWPSIRTHRLFPRPCSTNTSTANMVATRIMVRIKKENLDGPCQAVPGCDIRDNIDCRLFFDHRAKGGGSDPEDHERAVGQDERGRADRPLHTDKRQGRRD